MRSNLPDIENFFNYEPSASSGALHLFVALNSVCVKFAINFLFEFRKLDLYIFCILWNFQMKCKITKVINEIDRFKVREYYI